MEQHMSSAGKKQPSRLLPKQALKQALDKAGRQAGK
jgi:hypothetical protein